MSNSDDEAAVSALSSQISIIRTLYKKDVANPEFIAWRKETRELLQRYLLHSPVIARFDRICFDKPEFAEFPDMPIRGDFINGLDCAREYLEEAIQYIHYYGVTKATDSHGA